MFWPNDVTVGGPVSGSVTEPDYAHVGFHNSASLQLVAINRALSAYTDWALIGPDR